MQELFLRLLTMSAAAGTAAALVMLLLLVFRRLSGYVKCILWSLVGLRLFLPYSFADFIQANGAQGDASSFSRLSVYRDTVNAAAMRLYSGGANAAPAVNAAGNGAASAAVGGASAVSLGGMLTAVWLCGAALMLAAVLLSCIRLYLRLRTATRWGEGIYQSDLISTPFVFGLLKPRIYIPYSLPERDIPYVLAHEQAHIKRNDHIVKALALIALAFHWFNPLLWLAYRGLCRDIEMACDQRAIHDMVRSERQRYSAVLLSCSTSRNAMLCPIAFGEVGVKERITTIMKYTTPKTLTKLASVILCAAVAVCVLALPVGCGKEAPAAIDSSVAVNGGVDDSGVVVSVDRQVVETKHGSNLTMCVYDDGSIGRTYNSRSDVATELIQEFYYDCADGEVSVETKGGTSSVANEYGIVEYSNVPETITADSAKPIYWIPQEVTDADSGTFIQAKKATVTIKSSDGSDTAVLTIAADKTDDANYDELFYTIAVDAGHKMTLNDDFSITISRA